MNATLEETLLSGGNAPFLEALYEAYLHNPSTVDEHWQAYFRQLQDASGQQAKEIPHSPIREALVTHTRSAPPGAGGKPSLDPDAANRQMAVLQLINAYRFRGHQQANLDPLGLEIPAPLPELTPHYHGLRSEDMGRVFNTGSFRCGSGLSLADLLQSLQKTYCGSIGFEYMHITDTAQKRWLQERIEPGCAQARFDDNFKRHILERLVAAKGIENYLHTRYVGQKRFSLEGGESLIPLLDELIQAAGRFEIKEIIVGMAHRGRLNVLVNILGKHPQALFAEFEGKHRHTADSSSGDVKYHQGFSSDMDTPGGPVHLVLAFNPSHLEIINPVVEGSVRARQERRGDEAGNQVLAVLIHGDSAFSGQGVVMETLNLSQTRSYGTGGTVHIVINNQIGFTTSDPRDIRSTLYCTDVIKMVQAPIFHVNGDDPEAVLLVTRLALEFRMTFHKDVVIDLVCYRRLGHNEADEPAATQPVMYQRIKEHPDTVEVYAERLVREGLIVGGESSRLTAAYRDLLDSGRPVSRPVLTDFKTAFAVDFAPYQGKHWRQAAETAVPLDVIQHLSERLQILPEGFVLHPRVAKIMEDRRKMAVGALPMDWGFAEIMAYATLVTSGYPVRLSGQDSGRGTFFHRHSVLHNQKDGTRYIPLQNLSPEQHPYQVIDSVLSEEAVLAFEVGYSTACPGALTLWEGQFGDFANNAQVVIDQFISSSETKWRRLCGLVMLLPHGYEGQGPEHSSARLERYLQLCAEDNIQVCVPSSPAQIFHLLRRQVLRSYRKPLIIMSPKSLLRHPQAVSDLDELACGGFRAVIGEQDTQLDPGQVDRVVLCSGKVYYDLVQERRQRKLGHLAIVRLEQLYPFPDGELVEELSRYPQAKELVWAQEEPQNQGAWFQIQHRIKACRRDGQTLRYAGRPASASPAAGYLSTHLEQQKALVDQALRPV